jgi:capsid protein
VKEAQASALRIDGRISTLEREAAEQGQDWEEIIAQLARERAAMEAAGIAGIVTDLKIVPATDAQNSSGGEQGKGKQNAA